MLTLGGFLEMHIIHFSIPEYIATMILRRFQYLSFPTAIICLLAVTVLLCIPGTEFPVISWLDNIQFDKMVHIGLFSALTGSWCWALSGKHKSQVILKRKFIQIAILSIVYGIAMELIQHYFIPFRSFDYGDIIADGIGAATGYFLSIRLFIKI